MFPKITSSQNLRIPDSLDVKQPFFGMRNERALSLHALHINGQGFFWYRAGTK